MSEHERLRFDIQAIELLLKRLDAPTNTLSRAIEREQWAYKKRIQEASQYLSVEQARNDWGCDIISDKEFEEIERYFEKGEEELYTVTNAAYEMLNQYKMHLLVAMQSYEFDLLPPEEQIRIRRERELNNKGHTAAGRSKPAPTATTNRRERA